MPFWHHTIVVIAIVVCISLLHHPKFRVICKLLTAAAGKSCCKYLRIYFAFFVVIVFLSAPTVTPPQLCKSLSACAKWWEEKVNKNNFCIFVLPKSRALQHIDLSLLAQFFFLCHFLPVFRWVLHWFVLFSCSSRIFQQLDGFFFCRLQKFLPFLVFFLYFLDYFQQTAACHTVSSSYR